MILNLPDNIEQLKHLQGCFEVKAYLKTRSSQQNKALHLLFTHISESLNEIGETFNYKGIRGFEIETTWTPLLVKEMIWKPIQITMFGIESTTKINTNQINAILDVLTKYFGERGIPVSFPCQFDLWVKEINHQGYQHTMYNKTKFNKK